MDPDLVLAFAKTRIKLGLLEPVVGREIASFIVYHVSPINRLGMFCGTSSTFLRNEYRRWFRKNLTAKY